MQLSAVEVRVLGCLIEKELTVPDTYPMTVNGIVTAANQSTNRFPVTDYSTADVTLALTQLKIEHRLARVLPSGAGSRVDKYRHVLEERLTLSRPEKAILGMLALRGPQTVSELKARTQRMHDFPDIGSVERTINRLSNPTLLADAEEPNDARDMGMLRSASTSGAVTTLPDGYVRPWPGPLVIRLGRQPGQNEPRIMHLLGGPVDESTLARDIGLVATAAGGVNGGSVSMAERISALEGEVEQLKRSLDQLRQDLGA